MFNSTLLLLRSAGVIIINDIRVPGVEALLRTESMRVTVGCDFVAICRLTSANSRRISTTSNRLSRFETLRAAIRSRGIACKGRNTETSC